MSRIRYSAATKRHAADLVLSKHLSVAEVAQQVGCHIHSLNSWIKKYQDAQNPSPPTFVPITIVDPKSTFVEIVTPNGFTVRLNTPFSLGELFAAIASC